MTMWLLAGAISALVLLWDCGYLSFEKGIHLHSTNMITTFLISLMITLGGYISFICVGSNYGFEIYEKIKKLIVEKQNK